MFLLYKERQNTSQLAYHFAFTPAMSKSSYFSIPLPVFDIVSLIFAILIDVLWYVSVVSACISLLANDVWYFFHILTCH